LWLSGCDGREPSALVFGGCPPDTAVSRKIGSGVQDAALDAQDAGSALTASARLTANGGEGLRASLECLEHVAR